VDLITCSLVLEHIQNIDFIFQQANKHLKPDGFFYVGELHPFKQYEGSKARFETGSGIFMLECFTHHISDYMNAARLNKFSCELMTEWFDDNNRESIPRIIAFLFQKKG
jgi:2-polyprenyl-3-methyl-5-hydroxy-6-metoxy-1,4-benzoquinol methylase